VFFSFFSGAFCCYQKIVQNPASPPEKGIFEAKSLPKRVSGGFAGRLGRRTHLDPLLIRAYCRARRILCLCCASQMMVMKKVGVKCGNRNARGVAHLESRDTCGTRCWIRGTWHRVSAKHLPSYLDEMTWRFNNRKNPFLFRDTMLKLFHSENLRIQRTNKGCVAYSPEWTRQATHTGVGDVTGGCIKSHISVVRVISPYLSLSL